MKRLAATVRLGALALGFLSTFVARAQTAEVEPLGENLYLMSTSNGGVPYMNNLVLVGSDGMVLVDTTDAGSYSWFRAGLDQISLDPVSVLVNTHWHHDHTGLNADFVVNEGTETLFAHYRTGTFFESEQSVEDLGATFPALPPEAQPTDPIRVGALLRKNGETIALLPAPPHAHSGTDLLVYLLNADVLYLGDIYFAGMYPFIDRSSGGTIAGLAKTSRLVASVISDDTVVIPSHGRVGDRLALLEYADMLDTVRARVRRLVNKGMSEDEVVQQQPTADLDAEWGNGFLSGEVFTRIVYRGMTA